MSEAADVDAAEEQRHAAREQAIRLLARREHSQRELRRKLSERGCAQQAVEDVLASLVASGQQSDQRFAETYVRSALNRGWGGRKIRAALAERGVAHLARDLLGIDDEQWQRLAAAALRKRFGDAPAASPPEVARRRRFLLGRGFGCAVSARVVGEWGRHGTGATS